MFQTAALLAVLGFAAEIQYGHAFVPTVISPASMRTVDGSSSSSSSSSSRRYASTATTTPPEVASLPPHTFAGQVEQRMIERFGGGKEEPIERVLKSWRWLEHSYEHREYLGKDPNPENSLCHQYCHSYVPGLTINEFWDNASFDWTKKLASKYKAIRKEFLDVTADMARLQQEGNNVWAGALTEDAGSYGIGWNTLVLMDRSRWDPVNVNLFPVTAKAVHEAGVPAVEVFFASLQPDSNIKPHSDFTNFVLTSHLALDIPYSGENKCRIRIGDTTRQWINGEIIVFDTSLMHDAVNESDKTRFILMMRVWHPDLSSTERDALQFIYDALDFPDLLSTDANLRRIAEEQALASRVFPEIQRGGGRRKGFGGSGGSTKKKTSSDARGFGAK
eukprot:scaffold2092_cov144-Amphora_coffeaeformis.AAC.11